MKAQAPQRQPTGHSDECAPISSVVPHLGQVRRGHRGDAGGGEASLLSADMVMALSSL
jgi:hypothetical protein